jgi:hypothetical protein
MKTMAGNLPNVSVTDIANASATLGNAAQGVGNFVAAIPVGILIIICFIIAAWVLLKRK